MRSTMSTFKTRQSSAGGFSRSSIGVRYSMGGKASIGPDSTIKTDKRKLHTNKDPRKLSEKAYVLLFTFLLSSSQRQSGQFFFQAPERAVQRDLWFFARDWIWSKFDDQGANGNFYCKLFYDFFAFQRNHFRTEIHFERWRQRRNHDFNHEKVGLSFQEGS